MKIKGKKFLVVGLGKSGVSAAKFLCDQGGKVTATDTRGKHELGDALKTLGERKIDLDLGKHTPKLFTQHDYVVLSPGVPMNVEGMAEAKAAGIPVINDVEIASYFIKAPIVAITGTNGKTTTTTLIGEMLKNDGKKVFVGGNIGVPVLDLVMSGETPDVVVLELSSFQLESMHTFKPTVAVLTNLEPDHLDRYPTGVESYYAAKQRMIQNADKTTTLVVNQDNERSLQWAENFQGKVLRFSKRDPMAIDPKLAENFHGAYLRRPKMVIKGFEKGASEELVDLMLCKIAGDHNKENIMAAALAVRAVGGTKEGIQKTVDSFKGVSHRLEFVRKKDNVAFYNDSKATNVASVVKSLSAFNAPTILIMGGRDKDQDFGPLAELVKKRVKNLILLGEAKEKINRILGDYSETFLVGTFEEAILISFQKSRNGDVILLAPGCASYDMFKNYEERGDYFKKIVGQL